MSAPDAPTNLNAIAGDGKVTLSWTPPQNTGGSAITGYTIEVDGSNLTPYTLNAGNVTSFLITGLTNGTAYKFRVQAVNSSGSSLSIDSPPVTFEPNNYPGYPNSGPYPRYSAGFAGNLSLYKPSGSPSYKIITTNNWGYSTWDLSDPSQPNFIGTQDTSQTVPINGDGQSTVARVIAAADGSRIVLGMDAGHVNGENFLMLPSGAIFSFAGGYGLPAEKTIIQNFSGRYIAYGAGPSGATVAADITTGVPGSHAPNAIPVDLTSWTPINDSFTDAGPYIVYINGGADSIKIVTSSSPGAIGNITTAMPVLTIPVSVFNPPVGTGLRHIAAAVDPSDSSALPRMFILAAFIDSTTAAPTFILLKVENGVGTVVGSPFTPALGTRGANVQLFTTINDIYCLMVTGSSTIPGTENNSYYLTTSVNSWGVPPTSSTITSNGGIGSLPTRSNYILSGSNLYFYFSNSSTCVVATFTVGVGADGSGAFSDFSNTVTPSGTITGSPPSIVLNLMATASDSQVALAWTAPIDNGPFIKYRIVNTNTSHQTDVSQSITDFTDTNLTNDVTYTYTVSAFNPFGEGQKAATSATPKANIHTPGVPNNPQAFINGTTVTFKWAAPTETGGSGITQYKLKIYLASGGAPTEVDTDGITFQVTQSGLLSNRKYYFTVTAVNSAGEGPATVSVFFTTLGHGTAGAELTKISFNYKKFYDAPVILQRNSPDYLDFVYPQDIQEFSSSAIIGEDVVFPITIDASNNTLYFTINNIDVQFNLVNKSYTLDTLLSELEFQRQALIVDLPMTSEAALLSAAMTQLLIGKTNSQILFQNTSISQGNNLTLRDGASSAAIVIFGPAPIIVPSITIKAVENHIPTIEYDQKHAQALVESQPKLTLYHKDVTTSLIGDVPFTFDLPFQNIRQNTVVVQYLNSINTTTTMKDYYGDGRLLVKTKIKNLDDTAGFVYSPDPNTDSFGNGLIDYKAGAIENFKLPGYQTAKIIGRGASFPKTFFVNATLDLSINGVTKHYLIIPGTYTIKQMSDYLNGIGGGISDLKTDGLTVGIYSNQLYIDNFNKDTNTVPGPNKSLDFVTIAGVGSVNIAMFGLNPIIKNPPRVFISFIYTIDNEDPNKYIWYQTPHFKINIKANEKQSVSKAHIDYLRAKIDLLRPGNTILDAIDINNILEEKLLFVDTLDIKLVP